MNKTISINVSGFVFNIEEVAYQNLKEYLDKIRGKFDNEVERDEIMVDIELRIAELFQEKIAPNKEVITTDDILQIQEILGLPEDFTAEDEDNYRDENPHSESDKTEKASGIKLLYRDKDDAALAGVCSGLGYYFDIDRVVFRIMFVLLFVLFGTGFLLYIILWIVIPEAKSTSEKIEMKGEPVNLESIKEHVSNIKQRITNKGNAAHVREKVQNAVDRSTNVGRSVFHSVSKFFGVTFTIGGIITFAFLMLLLFGNTGILPFIGSDRINGIPELIEILYPGEDPSSLIFISLVLILTIPVIAMINLGVRIIFNYRKNVKAVSWSFAIIWTFAASVLFGYSIDLATHFNNDKEIANSIPLDNPSTNVLTVNVMDDDKFSNYADPLDSWNVAELIKVEEQFIYFGLPQLKITGISDTSDFKVSVVKQSRGISANDAIERIDRIDYPIRSEGNNLFISPYLKFPRKDKIRTQFVRVEIFVPQGKMVKFGKNIKRILMYIDNSRISDVENYEGSEWVSLGNKIHRNGSVTNFSYQYENDEANQLDEQSQD